MIKKINTSPIMLYPGKFYDDEYQRDQIQLHLFRSWYALDILIEIAVQSFVAG